MGISLYSKDWLESIVSTKLMFTHMTSYLTFRAKDCMLLLNNTSHGIFSTKVGTSTLVVKAHGDENILIAFSDYPVITLSDDLSLEEALLKHLDIMCDNHALADYGAQLCKGLYELDTLSKANSELIRVPLQTLGDKLNIAKKNFNLELVRVLNNAITVPGSAFVYSPNQSNIYRERQGELLPVKCQVSHDLEDDTVAISLFIGEMGTPEGHVIKSRMGITLLKLCDKYHRALFAIAVSNENAKKLLNNS